MAAAFMAPLALKALVDDMLLGAATAVTDAATDIPARACEPLFDPEQPPVGLGHVDLSFYVWVPFAYAYRRRIAAPVMDSRRCLHALRTHTAHGCVEAAPGSCRSSPLAL